MPSRRDGDPRTARGAESARSTTRQRAQLARTPTINDLPTSPPSLDLPRQLLYRALHVLNLGEVMHPKVCVFMVGLPGAGKSRIINLRYVSDHRRGMRKVNTTVVVDLDKEIIHHPEYDPKDPDKLYLHRGRRRTCADARVEARFLSGLTSGTTRRLTSTAPAPTWSARSAGWRKHAKRGSSSRRCTSACQRVQPSCVRRCASRREPREDTDIPEEAQACHRGGPAARRRGGDHRRHI